MSISVVDRERHSRSNATRERCVAFALVLVVVLRDTRTNERTTIDEAIDIDIRRRRPSRDVDDDGDDDGDEF